MLGILQLLGRKESESEQEITGFLTKDDMQKLKEASSRRLNPQRKNAYKTWNCKRGHSYFYAFARCPACESTEINERVHPVQEFWKQENTGMSIAAKGEHL